MPQNETDPLLFSGMMQEDDVPPNNSFSPAGAQSTLFKIIKEAYMFF